jgi:uncharacterized protein YdaU (DUF1376 family)
VHYYQFNIGDYSSHTKGLSLIEDLAYRRMIDEYYLSEQAFNGCSTDVARLIGLRDHIQEVEYILNRYFTKEGDLWVHGRIDSEIADYRQKQEKRSNAGKKSAEARQKPADVEHVLNGCSAGVELTNNHKPITNNQEPIVKDLVVTPSATPRKKASRLPDDWKPDKQYWESAQLIKPDMTQEWFIQVAHKFKDYWIAKAGKDATKTDWLATWRNWIRREAESGKGGIGTTGKKSYGEQRAELFDGLTDYAKATNF